MIKKIIFFIVILANFKISTNIYKGKSAVTYTFSGGRFGDNLFSYCHAKYLSFKYDIPLLYKPFYLSESLILDKLELNYDKNLHKFNFKKTIIIDKDNYFLINKNSSTLYVCPFFGEPPIIINPLFITSWKDKKFIEILKKYIAPINKLELIKIPDNYLSVAIHVRKGTGFDIPEMSLYCPLKFPPISFYIDQLNKIINKFPDKKLYVHIFTDHNNPEEIINIFNKNINNKKVVFNFKNDSHNNNVLNDFFSLLSFDCLIRPESSYSIIASKLANYKILISPWKYISNNNEIIVTETKIEYNN